MPAQSTSVEAALQDDGKPPGLSIERGEDGSKLLVTRQRLPVPREELFPFFADAQNLERLTPRWLRFEVAAAAPIHMEEGTRIDYRLRLRGIPLRWTSEIESWEPPFRFVDRQVRGPYRVWRHEHRFIADGEGTIAEDRVSFRAPLAAISEPLLVERDIRRIFAYRRRKMLIYFDPQAPAESKLPDCGTASNCASSLPGAASAMKPLGVTGEPAAAVRRLGEIIKNMPHAQVVEERGDYLHAEFRTRWLRFVDDAEFLLDAGGEQIHFVSSSRVGMHDLGVNRRRMERLQASWS